MMSSNAKSPLFRHLTRRIMFAGFLCLIPALALSLSSAEEDPKAENGDEKDEKSFASIIEKSESSKGLFPLHQDKTTGRIYLEIRDRQLTTDKAKPEFIHFSHTIDGVPAVGFFRGQFSRSRVFSLRRHFERIEFVAENTSFYFNPDSALKRASTANVSDAILASAKIVASDEETGRHLIEADGVFLTESFRQLKPGKKKDDDDDRFKLGDLSKDRTRFFESKTFPDNTLFRVQYVFENLHPSETGDMDVADSRFVTIKVQHTLIKMPKNDFEPRFEDPRVGYFSTQVTDLTSTSSAPYRDFIHRWHLKKRKPEAPRSKPVKPITWWIENTTPVELRDTIRDAVLGWNLAFESAGIIDAIEVKVQPDDAEWDADDIRYHVLRWTSSPDPPFGGYGPSFVNPRTGEIIGSDIMLEYIFMTNRVRLRELVDLGARERAGMLLGEGPGAGHFCQYGDCIHSGRIAGAAMLKAQAARFGNGPLEMDELLTQALTDLILHEVGHTLGLNHNFKASTLYDRKEIHNTELTSKTGLTGSVMEYSPINLALDPAEQGHYYSIVPGPYDHWAIRYGYDDDKNLESILAASTLPEHIFGNDADDMRSPGRGIDPRAMVSDLTSEPIAHSVDRFIMVKMTLPKLVEQFPEKGETNQELLTAFTSLMREYDRSAATISRYIGGVHVDRSVTGQKGSPKMPFTPISAETQRTAMKHLDRHVFGAGAIQLSPELIAHLQIQRRGFDFFDLDANEDPKVHQRILSLQKSTLDQLLHRHTLARVVDTGLYGNEYDLETFMNSLDASIMDGNPRNRVDTIREALQIEYLNRLINISGLKGSSKYPAAARGQAILLLEERVSGNKPKVLPTRHQQHIERLINNALEAN